MTTPEIPTSSPNDHSARTTPAHGPFGLSSLGGGGVPASSLRNWLPHPKSIPHQVQPFPLPHWSPPLLWCLNKYILTLSVLCDGTEVGVGTF